MADTVVLKVLELLRKAVKQDSNTALEKQIEDLRTQITAKDKAIEDLKEEKKTEIEAKDTEFGGLKTQFEALNKELSDIRQAKVNGLLSQIKTLDKDFDEKDLLEGVDSLCTQEKLLQKVLASVAKLTKKTDLSVDSISDVQAAASKVLLEMGISDVKSFIEG